MRAFFISLSLFVAVLVGYAYAGPTTAHPTRDAHTRQTQASAGDTFIEINDPLGVRGTRAWGIDPEGDIVGSYDDINKVRHGFSWSDGKFTTIDAPRAGHGPPGPLGPEGTTLYDINALGDIVGRYVDGNHSAHGFILDRGVFSILDDPKAGHGRGRGTQADGINDVGDIVGDYVDGTLNVHGFVLHDGHYTAIDAPHAEHGPYLGTHAFGINRHGDIVLFTEPGQMSPHGFLLHDGDFTRLDDPHGTYGTFLSGISMDHVIVGLWVDGNNVAHGLELCDGMYTTHDVADAGKMSGQGTMLEKISPRGDIAGWYTDQRNVDHGFLLRPGRGHSGLCDDRGSVSERRQEITFRESAQLQERRGERR